MVDYLFEIEPEETLALVRGRLVWAQKELARARWLASGTLPKTFPSRQCMVARIRQAEEDVKRRLDEVWEAQQKEPEKEEKPMASFTNTMFTPETQRKFEESFRNKDEAFVLLDLINAEFQSDPSSVACFDLRIVERVRVCVEKNKKFKEEFPLGI